MQCFLSNTSFLLISVVYLFCLFNENADASIKWPSHKDELKDEQNDREMLKAVQDSMKEWEKRKHNKFHRRKRENKVICYDELGCFEDSGPFGYLDMLPSSPEEINTKFYFYSTRNRSDRPLLILPYENLSHVWKELENMEKENRTQRSSDASATDIPMTTSTSSTQSLLTHHRWETLKTLQGFDTMSVRIIVHGFGASCPHVWIYELKTALMAVEECIVICVDWENGANLPNYVRAAANTRLIGKQTAMLIRGLEEYKKLELAHVHLIGFSLGAHAAGFAGAELPGLSRITGLDPAGPLFESQHAKARLDSTDANFVDVIHSNGENLILGGLGSWQPMGHVDFYPNGGRVQNGCSNLFVGAVTDFIWSPPAAVEGRSLCNHRRAYKFFIDSIAPRCLFPSFPCNSYDDFLKGNCFSCHSTMDNSVGSVCGNMGYYADRSTGRGQLYLVTREEEPFCAHQYIIEVHSSESDLPIRTIGRLEVVLEGDGNLNETFSITEKDDTEFFAGTILSRIVVPHPALGFPHSLTLTYKSYSGWLSKGLPYWTIHKVLLTDSFGKSFSYCKRHIILESTKSVYLKLQPGNCHLPDANDVNYALEQLNGTRNNEFGSRSDNHHDINIENNDGDQTNEPPPSSEVLFEDEVDRLRNKKDIINLGTNFKILENNTYSDYTPIKTINDDNILPWQPYLDGGNSLEKDSTESSVLTSSSSATAPNEIFEPILKARKHLTNRNEEKGRAMHTFNDSGENRTKDDDTDLIEIVEPILKSTTPRKRDDDGDENNLNKKINVKFSIVDSKQQSPSRQSRVDNSFFTVQLLPFRLGELIERAEKYARETLIPLISVQAPRFLGNFIGYRGTNDNNNNIQITFNDENHRQPKYFPSLSEMVDEENSATKISKRKPIDLPPIVNQLNKIELPEEIADDKIVNGIVNVGKIMDTKNIDNEDNNISSDTLDKVRDDQVVAESQFTNDNGELRINLLRVKNGQPINSIINTDEGQQRSLISASSDSSVIGIVDPKSTNHKVRSYYTNTDLEADKKFLDSFDFPPIKIELPTYKPSIRFPYKFEVPKKS